MKQTNKSLKFIAGTLIEKLSVSNLSSKQIFDLLEETIINMVDFYSRPKFKRFDFLEFHTKKSKLYIIVMNLMELQTSVLISPGSKEIIDYYMDKVLIMNPDIFDFTFIIDEIFDSINEGKIFGKEELLLLIKDELYSIILRDIKQKFDEVTFYSTFMEMKDLDMTYQQYKDRLLEVYDMILTDYSKFTNLYPEYSSKYIYPDVEINESIKAFIFNKVDFDYINFPIYDSPESNKIIFHKVLPKKETRRSMGTPEFIGSFSWNIINQIVNLIPYKNFKFRSNLKFLGKPAE